MNPEITSDAHENHRRISNAENFKASFSSPLSKIDFPMTGAQVFARVCKAEGLAGLFTCPGSYDIINALAEEGIPCWRCRYERSMANAADGFIRVSGEQCNNHRAGLPVYPDRKHNLILDLKLNQYSVDTPAQRRM